MSTADLPYLIPMTSNLLQKIQSVHWQPVKKIKKVKFSPSLIRQHTGQQRKNYEESNKPLLQYTSKKKCQ
jgi:hypothetical protein